MIANPARGRLNRKILFRCRRSRLKVESRETGSAASSRVSPLILNTKESEAYQRVPFPPPAYPSFRISKDVKLVLDKPCHLSLLPGSNKLPGIADSW